MARKIPLRELEAEIVRVLADYVGDIREDVKNEVKSVAKDMVKELRQTSPKDTGEYAKGWTQKTEFEDDETIRIRVYNNKKPHLTHLLENGHAKTNGGRVDGIPHIRPAEQNAEKKLGMKIKEVVR